MAELVDAPDSKSGSGNRVWVRFPLPAPTPIDPIFATQERLLLGYTCVGCWRLGSPPVINARPLATGEKDRAGYFAS